MFQLPPRTLANCMVLLIIKNPKEDNALECLTETGLSTAETEKSIRCTRKKLYVPEYLDTAATPVGVTSGRH